MAKISLPFIAWRGGRPRFVPGPRERGLGYRGEDLRHLDRPGQPWFSLDEARGFALAKLAEIHAARASGARTRPKPVARAKTVDALLEAFLRSGRFVLPRSRGGYSEETKKDYQAKSDALRYLPGQGRVERAARQLETFAKAPAAAIGKPEARAFYDYLARQRGDVMARGALMVLSAAYAWATTDATWRLAHNPCHELDLPTPDPRIRIAADTEISALMTAADAAALPEIGDAIFLGLFTGQRQADVLHLVPDVQTPDRQRFKQSKTGAIVSIPPTPQLAARLAAAAERRRLKHNQIVDTTIVIHGATGMRFVSSTFRHRFAEVRAAAAVTCPTVATLRYQDLRDTAVTWYARSGCTVPEIAAITGHSLRSVYSILRHYLSLDEHLADAAVAKLVAWMEREGIAV